ncbi:MAG: hypothetical protein J3K34DRAFT_519592, partial [Monoraphidium minutum]
MGQDYNARKTAKRGRKRMARDGAPGDGVAKRVRKKNQPRRLCRGVCFQQPALTEEDRDWDGREGGGSDDEWDLGGGGGGGGAAPGGAAAAAAAASTGFTVVPAGARGNKRGPEHDEGGDDGDEAAIRCTRRGSRKRAASDAAAAAAKRAAVKMTTSVRLLDPAALDAHAARGVHGRAWLSEPTPVQAAAWPPACGGADVQAVAEPGSGKTLGYLIPALQR